MDNKKLPSAYDDDDDDDDDDDNDNDNNNNNKNIYGAYIHKVGGTIMYDNKSNLGCGLSLCQIV